MRAKTKLLIIAGPQSSGKTTVFKLLQKKYPNATFVPEVNQYLIYGKKHLGSAYVTKETELLISKEDIRITKKIDRSKKLVIMETGIFHAAYLEKLVGRKTADKFYPKYLDAHTGLDPIILFIDTKPQTSFKRRKKIYLKRIADAKIKDSKVKQEMLEKYKKNIYDLYPFWIKYYKKFPFKKVVIKNSRKSYNKFIDEVLLLTKNII